MSKKTDKTYTETVEIDATEFLKKINQALEQVNEVRKTLKSIDLDDFDIETGGHK